MTSARAKFAHYFADFQSLTQGLGATAPSWLRDLRDSGWSRFNETGFPTARRGNERWKYTNVGPIAKIDFEIGDRRSPTVRDSVYDYQADGQQVYDLVYLDGCYSPELSSPAADSAGITAVSLASVASDKASGLEGQVGRYAPPDDHGFAATRTTEKACLTSFYIRSQ